MAANSFTKQKLLDRVIALRDAAAQQLENANGNKPLRNRAAGELAAYKQILADLRGGDYDHILYGATDINENAHIPH